MKKSRFLIATLAAAALTTSALGLAACSKDEGGSTPTTPPAGDGTYTVTFDKNGGTFPSGVTEPFTMTTTNGKLAALPTDAQEPTKVNYEFDGWTVVKDGDVKITTDSEFSADTTVYAKWKTPSTPSSGGGNTPSSGGNDNTPSSGDDNTPSTGDDNTPTTPTAETTNKVTISKVDSAGAATPISATFYVGDGADVFDYYTTETITFTDGEKVKFAVDGVNITQIWAKGGTAIKGVTGTGDEQGVDIDGDTVQIYKGGSYTVSVQQWNEGGKIDVYIGPYSGPFEGSSSNTPSGDQLNVANFNAKVINSEGGTVGEPHVLGNYPPGQNDSYDRQYSVKLTNLIAGQKVEFTIDGEKLGTGTDKLYPESSTWYGGYDYSNTNTATDHITITANGSFIFWIKHYPANNGNAACWKVDAESTVLADEAPVITVTVKEQGNQANTCTLNVFYGGNVKNETLYFYLWGDTEGLSEAYPGTVATDNTLVVKGSLGAVKHMIVSNGGDTTKTGNIDLNAECALATGGVYTVNCGASRITKITA